MRIIILLFIRWLIACFVLLIHVSVKAQPIRIAVAANAQHVIRSLQADFKKKTGIETEAIIGSSGKLTAQIKNGAPYDIFLSADMDFPNILYQEGLGITKPTAYALGSLIICTSRDTDVNNWRNLVGKNVIRKIAIANPGLAPYGKAAEQALRKYNLWEKVNSKLVYGESIAQVNTYITSGVVDLGFTTEALIHEYATKEKLKWIKVDEQVYEPIRQGMIVLKYAKKGNHTKAVQFYNYMLSASAKKILLQNGYRIP